MATGPSDEEITALEPALYGYAMRAVGDREQARDLVQETLLAAIAGRARFAGGATLRTWAIGILTHKLVDLFRVRQRARALSADHTSPDDLAEPTARDRPDRALDRRQALAILDAAIRKLPEVERVALLLVDVEGFDRDEACRQLVVTPARLRVLLHRGRHRLRRALEREGGFDGS